MTLLAGRSRFLLVGLSLFVVAPAVAQSLELAGPYGNPDGCKYAKDGQMSSDDVFLLNRTGSRPMAPVASSCRCLPPGTAARW